MPGSNTSGAPNTQDYVLGRGIPYLAQLDDATGLPDADGFRDLGNCTAFNISVSVEDLRHASSRECVKFTDKRFVISQEVGLSMTLDELNFETWSDALAGSQEVYDNGHDATVVDAIITLDVKLGRWYQLRGASSRRVYNLDAVGVVYTLEKDGAPDVLLVEGTDYEIDEQLGMVRILPAAVNITTGDQLNFSISVVATTPVDLDQVSALQRAEVSGALLFHQNNAGDCGQRTEFLFHKVSLTADGDISLIADEVSTITFNGVAEVNSLVSDVSKVLTVRTYNMV